MASPNEKIQPFIRTDIPILRSDLTLSEALEQLRAGGPVEGIAYIYVVDVRGAFQGVIPVRNLIFHKEKAVVKEVMTNQKFSLSVDATVKEALEAFQTHKFLALPVVDGEGHLAGSLEITALTETPVDITRRGDVNQLFETIGLRWENLRHASPFMAFRYRFPWLVPTIVSGIFCALLSGLFEATLAKSLILSFFLTLVLGLGESVSIQSLTLAINRLRSEKLTWRWFWGSLWRESGSAVLLGLACAAAVATAVLAWKSHAMAALSIGLTLTGTLTFACVFGLAVPSLLHALKLDPKVAAGPLVLALSDLATLTVYFSLAALLM